MGKYIAVYMEEDDSVCMKVFKNGKGRDTFVSKVLLDNKKNSSDYKENITNLIHLTFERFKNICGKGDITFKWSLEDDLDVGGCIKVEAIIEEDGNETFINILEGEITYWDYLESYEERSNLAFMIEDGIIQFTRGLPREIEVTFKYKGEARNLVIRV